MVSECAKPKAGRAKQSERKHDSVDHDLADLLKKHQKEIVAAWTDSIQHLPGPFCADLPPEELRSLTLRGVGAMVQSLETGSTEVLDEYLVDFCPAGRGAAPCASAAEALLLCKDAAVPLIRSGCQAEPGAVAGLVSQLDDCLRRMVGRLNEVCTAEMRRKLDDERVRVQMLLELAQTVGSTLELDEVVSRAAQQIVVALGADGCTFHLVNEKRRSAVFLRDPSDWSSRVVRSFDSYASAFHEVLKGRKPLTSYDVQSDARFVAHRMREVGYKSMLGVPLVAKGKVIAEAWAYTLRDHRRFTDEEIALAQGIANVLALVIQNAELYEQSKLVAVMEERTRLAREIHDGISQTLGALQLKASQLEALLSEERFDESRGHLTDLQDMISRAYRDLREAMFGLRAAVEPGTELVTALREYLGHYRAQYGLDVRLEASEDELAILEGETQAQAMRILQEALSNVRRHAGAETATVCIEQEDGRLCICVVDEGKGFDPAIIEGRQDGRHLGISTMRERAASVGGALIVESEPGHGTRVVLEVPLPRHGESE
jgi:signal transduction histidine kinase